MSFISRFRQSVSGVSAIEFALILPVMVTMFLGVVEVSNYVLAARKTSTIASTAADLVSQDNYVTNAEMYDIMGALDVIVAPLRASDVKIVITSVVANAQGVPKVGWSDARNATARTVGSTVNSSDFPSGMLSALQGAVMVEITMGYDPMFAIFLPRTDIHDSFYLKPRRSLKVDRGT